MKKPTKTLRFDDEVLAVIQGMTWECGNGAVKGFLTCGQLERGLYLRVNKALAAMGGKWNRKAGAHLFPHDPLPQVDGLLSNSTLTVVKDGYFPTPRAIGKRMIRLAQIEYGMDVLEPSAGTGELAQAIREIAPRCNLWTIESNPQRAKVLQEKGFDLIGDGPADFLQHHGKWDRIIQNPPFEVNQDIDHVMHAYSLLRPSGILVSVMSESPFFVDTHKCRDFRDWLEMKGGNSVQLAQDAFKESGAGCKSRIITVTKQPEIQQPIDVEASLRDLPLFAQTWS
jgi:hypothetical protein